MTKLSAFWATINPKVKAAALAALAAVLIGVLNAVAQVYPQWASIALILAPVIAGYLHPAVPKEVTP